MVVMVMVMAGRPQAGNVDSLVPHVVSCLSSPNTETGNGSEW